MGRRNGTGVYRMKTSGRQVCNSGVKGGWQIHHQCVCVCCWEREHLYGSMCDTWNLGVGVGVGRVICVFNILRQEFGTAGNWQILHPHECVKKVQPFIREACNLMGRMLTHGLREARERWRQRGAREGRREGERLDWETNEKIARKRWKWRGSQTEKMGGKGSKCWAENIRDGERKK